MQCVLLAGQIGVGKTTVASGLAETLNCPVVRVRSALALALGIPSNDRLGLQKEGAELDRRTNGAWLAQFVEELDLQNDYVVIDSLRTQKQTTPFLERLGGTLVYLDAPLEIRKKRFLGASTSGDLVKSSTSFDESMRHPTELGVVDLRRPAELLIDSGEMSVFDTVSAILRHLGA
jgi:cytidylate kinase